MGAVAGLGMLGEAGAARQRMPLAGKVKWLLVNTYAGRLGCERVHCSCGATACKSCGCGAAKINIWSSMPALHEGGIAAPSGQDRPAAHLLEHLQSIWHRRGMQGLARFAGA